MHDYSTNSPQGHRYWALANVLQDRRLISALDPIRPQGGPVTLCDGPSGPGLVTLAVQGGACFFPNHDAWGPHELWPDTCTPDDARPVCCPWRSSDTANETTPRADLEDRLDVFWGQARGATALFLGYSRCQEAKPGQTPLERVSQLARAGGRCWGDNGLQGETTAPLCSAP